LTGILFVTESFHPVLGGGETHIRRLGARLVRSGFASTVVTRRSERGWAREDEVDGIRVLRVSPAGPARVGKYLMVPSALAALRREARRHDVVVVRGTRILGVPALLAARGAGRPVVLQPEVNGEWSGEVYTWGHGRRAARLLAPAVSLRNLWLRDADAFVAMSRAIREEMVGAGVPRERVALIPHGVDTDRFRPADPAERALLRRRLFLPEGVLVLYTGRLLRGKGLETLMAAFASVAAQEDAARLVLVGSGAGQALSIEDALRKRASEGDLAGRVVFTGRVDDVADHVRAADIFAFPSVFEALGISLVEASAAGLPSVASRTGGIVDVIEEGRSGILVTPGSEEELASALLALVRSPPHRARMGREARRVALLRFDERDGVARYRALFRETSARR